MTKKTIIVTGSAGLVGSACVRRFAAQGYFVVGIDNDQRKEFFGASVELNEMDLHREFPVNYVHLQHDVREQRAMELILGVHAERGLVAVIHCAAQPSHDWAASDPIADFEINARGTLNLLEATRQYCPEAAFVFLSTNKVYGDAPNRTKLHIGDSAYQVDLAPPLSLPVGLDPEHGFNESLSVDHCMHSLFGCSKLAADQYVQEYGRYFGMNTVCFRCGCLTGGAHAGAEQHGFLSYLVKCCMTDTPYTIIGYQGKQVRDNLHADDVASAIDCYLKNPKSAVVYNLGGGRYNSCSVREAIKLAEDVSGKKMKVSFDDYNRLGDHKWWITDCRKFQNDYPDWRVTRDLRSIVSEIADVCMKEKRHEILDELSAQGQQLKMGY